MPLSIVIVERQQCALPRLLSQSNAAKGFTLDIPGGVATITAQFAVVVGRRETERPRLAGSADRGTFAQRDQNSRCDVHNRLTRLTTIY